MYGQLVRSEIEIEAGYPDNEGKADVVIRLLRPDEIMPEEHIVGRKSGVVRISDDTFFWIKDGNEIIIKPNDKTDWQKAKGYLINECMPAILFQRAIFTIHGSCVEINGGSVVITGASGAGKSSLSNEFLSAGYRLIADDTVGILVNNDGVFTLPAFPQRRLVGDMVDRMGLHKDELIDLKEDIPKYAINVGEQYCSEARPFSILVQLLKYPGETVEIHEITGVDKIRFLMDTSYEYLLYINDKLQKEEILEMVKICNNVPFFVMLRPEEGYTTKEQMNQILTNLF